MVKKEILPNEMDEPEEKSVSNEVIESEEESVADENVELEKKSASNAKNEFIKNNGLKKKIARRGKDKEDKSVESDEKTAGKKSRSDKKQKAGKGDEVGKKEPILVAKGLTKTYITGEIETHALKDATFEIYEGEFIVIWGPSGSGKSTLMNLIGGMDTITSGELYYRDQAVHKFNKKKLSKYRRHVIGFIFQFYNLLPSLNCLENVSLAAELTKDPLSVKEVLTKVGLGERERHFPSQLSGGEQQRVAVARAIVKAPEILLCDEPTGALDTETSGQVLELLREINQDYKKTVVVITHDEEVLQYADRFLQLRDGYLTEKEVF